MRNGMRWRRPLALLLAGLLLAAPLAQAGNWVTKGGTAERRSAAGEPVGLMAMAEAWRAELGQSATQPLVLGRTIYHLAGPYLWRLQVDAYGKLKAGTEGPRPLGNGQGSKPLPVNIPDGGPLLLSQSTPSYSAQTGAIYFGTAYGFLWAYYTKAEQFQPVELERGCPVVGSPLILRDPDDKAGREFVVVADRPNFPGEVLKAGQPPCPRPHGKVWVVSGLDRPDGFPMASEYVAETTKAAEGGFGGFITPSAVPGPVIDKGPTLLIGADGFEGGRAIRLVLRRHMNYTLGYTWWVDGPHGFAGSFASDGTNGYWLDTEGRLWGAKLSSGDAPERWPGHRIDLPAAIGASRAFTNTEPVVEQRPDGTYLYITLRNHTYPGGPALRDGKTGADGAVVAIGPQGQVRWHRRFGPADRDAAGRMASVNTTGLAIPSSNALLFGDVNGSLYSYALDSANRDGGHPQPFLAPAGDGPPAARLSLLDGGEEPARGWADFSQVSGVGVDPAMGDRLVLVGVNYERGTQAGGRLVAYRLAPAYNLAWRAEPPAEPLQLKVGQAAALDPQAVAMQLFAPADEPLPDTLGQLCVETLAVQWYVTGPGGYVRELWPEVALPGGLGHGGQAASSISVALVESDPDEGQIVGIIDHSGVMALAGAHPASPAVREALRIGQAAGVAPRITCRHAAEIARLPGVAAPLGGLADNLLAIPYRKVRLVDDPFVAKVTAPQQVEGDRFTARVYLGYVTSTEADSAAVELRVWVRSDPASAPAGEWVPVTVPRAARGESLPWRAFSFEGMAPGSWEVVAEVRYPGDTDTQNNRKGVQVELVEPPRVEAPGQGSGLSG